MILIVSRDPCPGALGCDAMLRSLIPTGATLHVYVAEPDKPVRFFDSHTGNGKGVRS